MERSFTITRNKTECFCINLRRASTAITKKYDNALAKYDVTTNQFSIINNIKQLEKCNVIELATRMGLERTTLLRNIKPLIKKEYILETKENNKAMFSLTSSGKELYNSAHYEWDKIQYEINDKLGSKASQLIEILNEIEEI
ncbi:DNA-binding MarR family transcriptional regulator [Bacilli bacterium PM5-9]|nr:DNA-binding MarR family transcriptional regulator [Bacilli bacterium PM5-9]